jgi:hypothetical protein
MPGVCSALRVTNAIRFCGDGMRYAMSPSARNTARLAFFVMLCVVPSVHCGGEAQDQGTNGTGSGSSTGSSIIVQQRGGAGGESSTSATSSSSRGGTMGRGGSNTGTTGSSATCPVTQPNAGMSCAANAGTTTCCPFSQNVCLCSSLGIWQCGTPQSLGMGFTRGTTAQQACASISGGTSSGAGGSTGGFTGFGRGGSTGTSAGLGGSKLTDECPGSQPSDGVSCSSSDLHCAYDDYKVSCMCVGGSWTCAS